MVRRPLVTLHTSRLTARPPPLASFIAATQDGGQHGTSPKESRGWFSKGPKQPLVLESHSRGELQPHEVDIQVTHNGVCHSDLHMRDNEWGITSWPFIPGHEVVGKLLAKGSQVSGLVVGQRLGVGWLKDSCRRCYACLRGQENICQEGYTGTITGGGLGGFQSVIRVNADFAYVIPDGLDSALAAPLLCAGITVYTPLRRYVAPGMTVAVLGVGGLGHLAVQFAAAMGANVTALDRNVDEEKEAEIKRLGANTVVDSAVKEHMAAISSAFDIIINCASANMDTGMLLGMLRNDGTLIQVGIPGGGMMQLPVQNLVFGQKRVAGSIVGGRADMAAMLQLAAARGIAPLIERLPMSKANEGMDMVAKGKAHYRVVLCTDMD